MKKIYRWWLLVFILCAGITFSCVKDYIDVDPATQNPESSSSLTVEEAKVFFEASYKQASIAASRSGDKRKRRGLLPGDFTPRWEKASISKAKALSSADIPIMGTEGRYKAHKPVFVNNKVRIISTPISQKLIVVKDEKTKMKASYILSLVPSPKYYKANRNKDYIESFINSGSKANFSGIASYYDLNGVLIRIDEYHDGIKTDGIFVPKAIHKDKEQTIKKVKSLTRGIKIQSKENIVQSRWGEDDWWDDDDDDWWWWDDDDDWWWWDDDDDDNNWWDDDDNNWGDDDDNNGGWTWDDFFDWLEDWFENSDDDYFHWDDGMGEPPWSPDYDDDDDWLYDNQENPYENFDDWRNNGGGSGSGTGSGSGGYGYSYNVYLNNSTIWFDDKNGNRHTYSQYWTVIYDFGTYIVTEIWVDTTGDGKRDTVITSTTHYYTDPGDSDTDGGNNGKDPGPSEGEEPLEPDPDEEENGGNGGPNNSVCNKCNADPCACPKENPCDDKGANNALAAKTTLDRYNNDPNFRDFLNKAEGAGIEYISVLNCSYSQGYSAQATHTDNLPDRVKPPFLYVNKSIGSVHNHPKGTPPSAADVEALIESYLVTRGSYTLEYIYLGNGQYYLLYVTDVSKIESFNENFYMFQGNYERASYYFSQHGHSSNDARMYGLAYALQKLDSGISILKSENGKFMQLSAEGIENSEGYDDKFVSSKCK